MSLLSADLQAELGGDTYGANVEGPDANAAIIVPAPKPAAALPAKRALTSRQKKRLTTLAERLAKQDARPALYASLSKNAIQPDHLKLLHGTSSLGQKETLKQKLKRALQEEKSGIEQSDPSVQLYQARPPAEGPAPLLQQALATDKDAGRKKRKNKAAGKNMDMSVLEEKQPQVRQPAKRFAFGLEQRKKDGKETVSDSGSEEEKEEKIDEAAKLANEHAEIERRKKKKEDDDAQKKRLLSTPSAAASASSGGGFVIPDAYMKPVLVKQGKLVAKRKADDAKAAQKEAEMEDQQGAGEREEEEKTEGDKEPTKENKSVAKGKNRKERRKMKKAEDAKKRKAEEEKDVDDDEGESEDAAADAEAEGEEENDGEEKEVEEQEEEQEEEGESEDDEDDEDDEEGDDEDENEEAEPEVAVPDDPLIHTGLFHFGQLQGVEAGMREAFDAMTKSGKGIAVQRTKEIMEQRRMLPIMNEETEITSAVEKNDVLVLCGETGSGKTTQVPQFLYEKGYTMEGLVIGITEPRRVAAVSVSERVGDELGDHKKVVGYQIRYDSAIVAGTRIKFMTDGILLKEIQADLALRQYGVLILDEAHERSLNTDILLGLLSRVVRLRREMFTKKEFKAPLKLIVMSATLRVDDFTKNRRLFFDPPPVLKVDARQYPVTIHFNRKTAEDYLAEAFGKVCKIHRTLPPGAVLVFLTGQGEIDQLCKKLRAEFPASQQPARNKASKAEQDKRLQREEAMSNKKRKHKRGSIEAEEIEDGIEGEKEEVNEEEKKTAEEQKSEDEKKVSGDEDGEEQDSDAGDMERQFPPLLVLPLYSMLSTEQQMRVFQSPPPGVRLCVVATNVAETSLTIPGVKYIVDAGRAKERFFDRTTGIARFEISWISQAAANQRAGRAGRTEAGHCYRLYSSAIFGDFPKFGEPEIMRMPVEGVVLQMKSMGVPDVATFPFATPPPQESITAAVKTLVMLGALEVEEPHKATELGFPPRCGKLLVNARGLGCLNYALALAALLSVSTDPIMRRDAAKEADENATEEEKERVRQEAAAASSAERQWRHQSSDLLGLLKAYGAFEFAGCTESFCHKNALHFKTMREVHDLRAQLHALLKTVLPDVLDTVLDLSRPPTDAQQVQLRQLLLGSYLDQVAKLSPIPSGPNQPHVPNHYITSNGASAYIHPTSSLAKDLPSFVLYRELIHTSRPYMRGVTAITASWISALAPQLCKFSDPLENPTPKFNAANDTLRCFVNVTYGPSWPLPVQEIDFPAGHEKVKHFARLLLEGEIFPRLADWWASRPTIITRSWEMPKILDLVSSLQARDAVTRSKMEGIWAKEPKYLLKEVLAWVLPEHRTSLTAMWPPLNLKKKNK